MSGRSAWTESATDPFRGHGRRRPAGGNDALGRLDRIIERWRRSTSGRSGRTGEQQAEPGGRPKYVLVDRYGLLRAMA